MPVNEDIFDNIPIGQKPLIWPTVHCLSSDFGEHLNLNKNNYAEWETDKLEQNLKLVLHIRHEHQLLCMNGNTLKQKNLTSRIKVRVRVRGPICLDFLRC